MVVSSASERDPVQVSKQWPGMFIIIIILVLLLFLFKVSLQTYDNIYTSYIFYIYTVQTSEPQRNRKCFYASQRMRPELLPAVVWGLRYAVLFAASRRFSRCVSSASFCCSSVGRQLRYVGDMRRMLCARVRSALVLARVARRFRHACNCSIPLGTS